MGSSAEPLIPIDHFSTDGMTSATGHEAWRNLGWPSVGPMFEVTAHDKFEADLKRFRLGDVSLAYAGLTAQDYHRPERMTRDGIDHLAISLRLSGEARGDADGRDFVGKTGSLVFVDMARANAHASEQSRTVMLHIPRAVAEARISAMDTLHGAVVSSAGAALLRSHLMQIGTRAGSIRLSQAPRLGDTVVDLLAVALSDAGAMAPIAPRETALYMKACAAIDARLGSPTLGTASLCRTLGISRSTLYRLFETEGGVQAYIRERRLEAIRLELLDPAQAHRSITELAERWGFCDAAYLSRTFRQTFGVSPSEARGEAGAALQGRFRRH